MVTKVDILAIGVHPDDIELSVCGSLLQHIQMGKTIGLLDLTKGELGTRGNATLRSLEAMKASEMMGAEFRYQLDLEDGFFEISKEHILDIIKIIRACKPQIVLANAIHDRHPDHGRASELISRACFLSGLVKIKTQLDEMEQEAWRPTQVYHYIQDIYIKPDFVIDITSSMQNKMDVIKCFASQFYNPISEEPESPISGKDFLDVIQSKARIMGRYIGVEFGEGFTVERPIKIDDFFTIK